MRELANGCWGNGGGVFDRICEGEGGTGLDFFNAEVQRSRSEHRGRTGVVFGGKIERRGRIFLKRRAESYGWVGVMGGIEETVRWTDWWDGRTGGGGRRPGLLVTDRWGELKTRGPFGELALEV